MAIQRELFGDRVMQRIHSHALKANSQHKGKHHPITVATNLRRVAVLKKKGNLTIQEAIHAEKTRGGNFVVIAEALLRTLEKKHLLLSVGKTQDMERQIRNWEEEAARKRLSCNRNKDRYRMYDLLQLNPQEVFDAELYMIMKKLRISEKSDINAQTDAVRTALKAVIKVFA